MTSDARSLTTEPRKPSLLDLFCGAGGAAKGYQRAGFYVVGVDIKPQPRYCGDEFHQGDAMTFPLEGFDAIHASPPCQRFSSASKAEGTWASYPDLLTPIRERLRSAGVPWVIENVPGAPMRADIKLCGCMFRLGVRRLRLFETEPRIFVLASPHRHDYKAERVYGCEAPPWLLRRLEQGVSELAGRDPKMVKWQRAMAIDWMETREEMREAIPPAYTEFLGTQLMRFLERQVA